MMKVDLHTHTLYSHDACSSLAAYIFFARRRGLDCVAVTDHNEIEGALALRRIAPFPVIVGEEIKTSLGDVIGLFLTSRIAPGMSVENTIDAIRMQGGVVYIPHPSWSTRAGGETVATHMDREGLWGTVDGVEILNGRTLERQPSKDAVERAVSYNLFQGAGSDAHTPFDLGRAFIETDDFSDSVEFLRSASKAHCSGKGGTRQHRAVLNRFVRRAARRVIIATL